MPVILRCEAGQLDILFYFRRVLNVVFLILGWFPGVWTLYADVSEQSVPSSWRCKLFIPLWRWNWQCSETSAYKIHMLDILFSTFQTTYWFHLETLGSNYPVTQHCTTRRANNSIHFMFHVVSKHLPIVRTVSQLSYLSTL